MRTSSELKALGVFTSVQPDKVAVQNLLAASERKLADSKVAQLSFDTRVEAVYDAMYTLCSALLACLGVKSACAENHHIYVLEAACAELGASSGLANAVDALRRVRNMKYTGVTRCMADYKIASSVYTEVAALVEKWMAKNLPILFRH